MPTARELVSLMTEEVKDFENAVKRLDGLNQNLSEIDLKPNLSEVQNTLNQKVDEQVKRQERALEDLQNFVTKTVESQNQPRWLIISKLSLVLLSLLFVFYAFYKIDSIPKLEKEAYDKGQKNILKRLESFLIENEEASKLYDEWLRSRN